MLTPEQLARIEAGVATEEDLATQQQVETDLRSLPTAESTHEDPLPEAVEDVADEVEDLSEQLALQSIISDEKFEEVLECLKRLEQSSTMENPSLAAMHQELLSLRSELLNLKSSVDTIASNQTQRESVATESEEPRAESPIDVREPSVEVQPEPVTRKKNRFI